jgi:NAD(P)-dependent dehydrogenase (short-subunit alcohol dehydrogenase family)
MGVMDGKVAIVTGAGAGIGRAEALLFAQEGARVVVNDLGCAPDGTGASTEPADAVVEEIRRAGGQAVASYVSVVGTEGAEAVVAQAVDTWGRLDAFVSNAGILRDRGLLKVDAASWQALLDVHLTGAFFASQAAARQMIAQGEGGRIVHTTSLSGLLGNFGQVHESAAKAGVYGLMRTLAIELQRHRITVNAVAPVARTRLTEDLPMFQSGLSTLTPEHVAPAALFLASDLAGDRTGHVLAVAGAQVYALKLIQTPGKFKDGDAPWTAAEIAAHWDAIVKA